MPTPVEPDLDPMVDESLAQHSIAEAHSAQQIDGRLLQDAGPEPVFDVGAVAILEHDRFDPLLVEQVRKQQSGRTGPDDRDLGFHRGS